MLFLLSFLASGLFAKVVAGNTVKTYLGDSLSGIIQDAEISDQGNLVLLLSDGKSIDAGNLIDQSWFEKTVITEATINNDGDLVLTTASGDTINAGAVINKEWVTKVETAISNIPEGVIGTAGACYFRYPPTFTNVQGKVAYVTNVYIEDLYRKRGIATDLMNEVMEDIKERGCKVIRLHASDQGRRLYEKLGFVDAEGLMIMRLS